MTWWRRNRWALLALLPALALALVASSDRVSASYWTADLHDARPGTQGEWVEHRDAVPVPGGEQSITMAVRLDGVSDTDQGWESSSPLSLPPGAHGVRVDLSLRAAPDEPLVTCQLAVRDADGTRYDYDSFAAGGTQPSSPCVPPDASGPWPERTGSTDAARPARPQEWSVAPVVVVPGGVEITEVLLWWAPPTYLELSVD